MTDSTVEQLINVRDTKQYPMAPPVYSPDSPRPTRASTSSSTALFLMIVVFGIIVVGIVGFCLSSYSLAALLPASSSHATPPSIPTAAATTTTATTATTLNTTHAKHIHYHHRHHPHPSPLQPVEFQVHELQSTVMIEQPQTQTTNSDFDISQASTDVGAGYGAIADMQQLQQDATQYRNMYPENNNMPVEYRYQNPNYAPQQAIDPNPVYGVFGPQPAPAAPQQAPRAQFQQVPQAQPFQQTQPQQAQFQQPQPFQPAFQQSRPMIQPQPLPPGRQAQTQTPISRVATFPQPQTQPSNNMPFPNPPAFPSPPHF